jgi:hypothetical protein
MRLAPLLAHRKPWLLILAVMLAGPDAARAMQQDSTRGSEAKPKKGVEKAPTAPTQSQSPQFPLLDIQLSTSRAQFTPGGQVGISGLITNKSPDSTLYLTERSVTLFQPPELADADNEQYAAWFVGELQFVKGKAIEDSLVVAALKPGQSQLVGWTPFYEPTMWEYIKSIVTPGSPLFFYPGDYRVSIQAKYWTDPKRPPDAYLTANQTIVLHMVAPQWVILFGAGIGGLLGFIFMQPENDWKTRTLYSWVWAGIIAMLWSLFVAVLLSRLSAPQLPIQVTVADFWGAIVIGALAQFTGRKIRDVLAPAPTVPAARGVKP